MKEQMQYCIDHPEEISKLAKVKAQVSEVKGVMMENIEKVEKIDFHIGLYCFRGHISVVVLEDLEPVSLFGFLMKLCPCRFLIVARRLNFWWIRLRIFAHRYINDHTMSRY